MHTYIDKLWFWHSSKFKQLVLHTLYRDSQTEIYFVPWSVLYESYWDSQNYLPHSDSVFLSSTRAKNCGNLSMLLALQNSAYASINYYQLLISTHVSFPLHREQSVLQEILLCWSVAEHSLKASDTLTKRWGNSRIRASSYFISLLWCAKTFSEIHEDNWPAFQTCAQNISCTSWSFCLSYHSHVAKTWSSCSCSSKWQFAWRTLNCKCNKNNHGCPALNFFFFYISWICNFHNHHLVSASCSMHHSPLCEFSPHAYRCARVSCHLVMLIIPQL